MSTIAVLNEPTSLVLVISLFAGAMGSYVLAWWFGVTRRGSVVGRRRWLDEAGAGTMFGLFLVNVVAWLVVLVAVQQSQQSAGPTTNPAEVSPESQLRVSILMGAVSMFSVLVIGSFVRPRHIELLGLSPRSILPALLRVPPGIVIIMFPVLLVGIGTAGVWELLDLDHASEHAMLTYLRESKDWQTHALIMLAAWVVAPLAEEVLFRGHLQTAMAMAIGNRRDGPGSRWAAIFVTSALFAAVHPWWSAPPIFFLSVCLGYAYERTGNLWLAILLHSSFNIIQTLLFLAAAGANN